MGGSEGEEEGDGVTTRGRSEGGRDVSKEWMMEEGGIREGGREGGWG